jgi:4-hydroxy-tetrahydrodipicolinate synthase
VASARGVTAITTNAHASEVASCTFDEQRRILDITVEEMAGRTHVVQGIYAEGSFEAQRIAKMAHAGGASALLVFPSGIYTFGQRPEMAVEHFRRIAEVTDLPLIAFQYPLSGGQGYPLPTLLKIIEQVPTVRAIKDWSANPQLHERQVRVLQSLARPVNVLTTHSAWLFNSLVIANLQAQLFRAVQAGDLALARQISDRIFPTAEVFYSEPWVDMHNRMKEALVMLGKLPRAVVRPPLMKLPQPELDRIRRALQLAGLLK